MSSNENRIHRLLAVSHDASMSGAPILLLHILRWMKREKNIIINLVLIKGGELEEEFRKVGSVTLIDEPRTSFTRMVDKILKTRLLQEKASFLIRTMTRSFRPDIVYANTAVSISFLNKLNLRFSCPVVGHVHELNYIIHSFVGHSSFRDAISGVTHFIAVSNAVSSNLINNYSIHPDNISIIPEPIEISSLDSDPDRIRQELDIPKHNFLVVGAGTIHWRKGVDLFVHSAALAKKMDSAISFVWFGAGNDRSVQQLMFDIEKLGLNNTVFFAGTRPNLSQYFAAADVFFLTSREDPYPLVCLEAASCGKPIICFDEAGGMPEFVSAGAGYVVPYMDLQTAVLKMLELKNDRAKLNQLGEHARKKAIAESDIRVVGPRIWQIFQRVLITSENTTY